MNPLSEALEPVTLAVKRELRRNPPTDFWRQLSFDSQRHWLIASCSVVAFNHGARCWAAWVVSVCDASHLSLYLNKLVDYVDELIPPKEGDDDARH